ncbi:MULTISPECIES: trehalose-6-phosphate synthase [Actinoallomurus]|uniref:trehalose-6-phosphate synthase n=1 Tax=Actinoallomurus TaxID=667113 RepID=UPI002093D7A7|nr:MULTISPECIES: trehalose-6-phosphate synthase [Actinoallomurus]MCO5972347.1 trehalose-6-phosphate synthase [Actinoallomurus soli]MCO5996989.1 trehalose-6-phosphate synthase [Actinoallomurus rhizosphaericola]
MSKRVFLASKRAVVTYAPDPETGALRAWLAPGGTGNVVAEQAGYLDVAWIVSADSDADHRAALENPEGMRIELPSGRGVRLHQLRHDRETFRVVQDFFTAELMWAGNNYGWDRWTRPSFGAETRAAWERFGEFTEDFAGELLRRSEGEPDPVFLVHDYQLVRVPQRLRAGRPDAPILLFVHIPWPSADYWRILPKEVRTGVLEGMLAADVIGFFARRWSANFLACVADLLPDAEVDAAAGTVRRGGHVTRVCTQPLGYSPETLHRRDARLPGGIAEWAGDRPLVVHSGRTDPIKNAERAVRAFVLAVEANERLRGTRMLVRMNPNRLYVEANDAYRRRVEAAVAEANAKLGADTVRTHCDNDVGHTFGCFERADLLVFNSTVDGQNLSVFEAPLVNERDADVVLSEMAGAAEILGPVCRTVNPFDLAEQAEAIAAGLLAGPAERAEAARRRRDTARPWTLEAWVTAQLTSLGAA